MNCVNSLQPPNVVFIVIINDLSNQFLCYYGVILI